MATLTVHDLSAMAAAEWSFRDSLPKWRHHSHGTLATFDPFPAYPHERMAVEQAVAHVVERCPPIWDVELHIADREEVGRSNGFSHANQGSKYVGDEWVQDTPTGLIVLSGKRVPPHPAVTAYLVAHEYGHNVEWMLEWARDNKRGLHRGDVIREYAKLRGLPDNLHHGSGGRWHDSATEIFACDFRIVVCNVEPEYWPHPSVPRPDGAEVRAAVADWWERSLDLLTKEAAA